MSKFILNIVGETPDSTLSRLIYTNDITSPQFVSFVIEDGFRPVKEHGKTRIPPGNYQLQRRYEGRHFAEYSKKYGHKHTFQVMDVAGFSYIMAHIGNYVTDTEGCILTNMGAKLDLKKNLFIGQESTPAYHRFYEIATKATEGVKYVPFIVSRFYNY